MNVSDVVGYELRSSRLFLCIVSVLRVFIIFRIGYVKHSTIEYLCFLFVGDDVERLPDHLIR
jgi:hypothetical protein